MHLVSHPRNRKQSVTDDTEERSDAPYGEHVLLVARRKASTIGDGVADRLPPAGQSAWQPAGCINDCKRNARNDGQIEQEDHSCNEEAENDQHKSLLRSVPNCSIPATDFLEIHHSLLFIIASFGYCHVR